MKVLLLFIFIYFVSSFKLHIGYLTRTGEGDDKKRLEMVEEYIKDHSLSDNDIEIKFTEYPYIDTSEELIKTLENVPAPKPSFYYTTCTPNVMNDTVDDFLTKEKIFIWCLNTYNVGRCSRNFIMVVQLMSPHVEAVGFIGDDRPVDEFIAERIFPGSYYFGQSEIGNYHHRELNESIFKEYLQNITSSHKKVVTYWSSWNSEMYNKFLLMKITEFQLSNEENPVIVLNAGFDQGTFESAANNENNYHLRGYDEFLNSSNELSIEYQSKYKQILNSKNQYEEVYILGVMNMLLYALSHLQSTNILDLLTVLYNKEIPYAGGYLVLLENHYTSTTEYLFKKQDPKPNPYIPDYQITISTSFEPMRIMGQIGNKTCNFTLNHVEGTSDYTAVIVMFIQRIKGIENSENRYLREFFLYLVERINLNGGIAGKHIRQLFVNIDDKSMSDLSDEIIEDIEKYDVHSGFLVCSSEERKELSLLLQDEDFQLFYLSPTEGDECLKNIIYVNPMSMNYIQCTVQYLNTFTQPKYVIVSSGNHYGRVVTESLINMLNKEGYDTNDISVSYLVQTDNEYLDKIINRNILDYLSEGFIIITATQEYQIRFFERLINLNVVADTNYTILSFTLNEAIARNIGFGKMGRVKYLTHYYDDKDSDVSNILIGFREYMKEQCGYDLPLTNAMGLAVNMINIFANAVMIRSYYKPSDYLQYIYHDPLKNPIAGPFEIYFSGYGIGRIRIVELNTTGASLLVFEDKFNRIENVYRDGEKTCNWKKFKNGVSNYNYYFIGVLFDSTSSSGRTRYQTLQLNIDLFNQEGGINGRDLVILQTEYKGDPTTIATIYEKYVKKYKNILCFIGTDTKAERQAVYKKTEEYGVVIFAISAPEGNGNYKYIIQMAFLPHQTVSIPLYYAYTRYKRIAIIYTKKDLNLNRLTLLEKYSEYYKKEIVFVKELNSTNIEDIVNETKIECSSYDTVALFLFTDPYTYDFVVEYNNKTIDNNKYPLFIFDYRTHSYYDNNFINCYGIISYYRFSENAANTKMLKSITGFKGEETLVSTEGVFMYDIFLFLQAVVPKVAVINSDEILNQLYLVEIESPSGKRKITTSNWVTSYSKILKCIGYDKFELVVNTVFPIMPYPYYFVENDMKYLTVSYKTGDSGKLVEYNPIKIAYFLDFNDDGFNKYILALSKIEQINYAGGINGNTVVSELYSCPDTEKEAASVLITLYKRGFKVFIGGCNPTSREAMQPTIEALSLLLVYTGFNEGQDCSQHTIYMSTSPSQDIIPYLLHLLMRESSRNFAFIHSNDKVYKNRIDLVNSVFNEMKVDLLHVGEIDITTANENNYRLQVIGQCRMLEKILPHGGVIVVMLQETNSERFFKYFYEYFNGEYGDSLNIAEKYTIYLIDDTHRKFDPSITHSEGNYIYTSDIYDPSDPVNVEFKELYNQLTGGLQPTYSDILIYDSTAWVLSLFSSVLNYDNTEQLFENIYKIEIASVMGKIAVDSGNHVAQTVFFGRINKDGNTELLEYVSRDWRGEAYRSTLNRNNYIICDWKDRKVDVYPAPFTRIGIIIPNNRLYLSDGILFFESVYAAFVYINENGGIKGTSANLVIIIEGKTYQETQKILIDYATDYDMFIFFGGWTSDMRDALHRSAVKTNSLLFYPRDYEANECHENGFYGGIGYPTYYTLVPTIMKLNPGVIIILYSDTIHSAYYAEKLKYDLNIFNIIPKVYLQFPLENKDMGETVQYIERLSPDGALIVSILEGIGKSSFLEYLHKSDLASLYTVLCLNMGDLDIYKLGEAGVGVYYYDTFTEDNSNPLYTEIKSTFTSLFAYIPVISRSTARGFMFANLIAESTKNAEVTFRGIKDALYDNELDTVIGKIHFNLNNRYSSPLLLKRGSKMIKSQDEDGNILSYDYSYEIVEQTSFAIPQKAFGNVLEDHEPVKDCDLRDGQIVTDVEIKKIALVFATSGIYKKTHEKALLGAITALRELYDGEKILENRLLVKFINYNSDLEGLQNSLNEVKEDENVVAYIGCTSALCKNTVNQVAVETNKLYYFPRITAGEECDYYTFYTSMVANQFITRLMEFLLVVDYENNYYILTEDSDDSKNLATMIRGEANGLINEKGSFNYNETSQISYDLFDDIQSKMSEGGIIISAFVSIEVFKNFMEYYSRLNIDSDKYAVVDIFLEVEETDTIPAEDRKDIYKIVRYSYDLPTEENKKFKNKALDYVSLDQPTSLFEAAYSAVHLYAQAVIRANSFETEKVRKGSYGASFQVGSGIITMNDNNYVTAPFFVIRYNSDGLTYQTIYSKYDVQSASPWNWNIPTSYGYQCSFSNKPPEIGYKYKVAIKRVGLIAALSTSKNAEGYVDIFQMAANEINDNGGIGGYSLKTDIYDTQGSLEICIRYITDYINENHPVAIFGSVESKCIESLDNIISSESELIFFNLLEIELNYCNAPIFLGVKHASLYDKILDVIRNRFYQQIMVFIDSDVDDYNGKYVEKYLKNMEIDDVSEFIYEIDDIENSKTQLRDIIIQLSMMYSNRNIYNEKSVCILFFGYEQSFAVLMDIINEANNNGNNNSPFNVIIMENSHHMRELPYYNYEYMEFYNPDDRSDLNMNFKNKLYQRIDSNVYVSDVMIRTYSSIKLWQTALDSLPKNKKEENMDVVNVERNNVRVALRTVKYNSPEGLVYFGVNQYLSRIPKILKYNENKTSTLIYDSTDAIVPEAFEPVNGVFKKCDFNDLDIEDGNTVPTYTILIMLSLSGEDREIETPIFDSLIAAIGDINRNGLLLDNYINYTVIDTKSSDDIYESELLKLVNNTRYTYIFGGYKPSTLKRIGEILTGSDKLFFFLGRSIGDTCYQNVISTHLHPSQITQGILRRLLEFSSSAFILRSNDEFATTISNLMTEKMKNLIITSNGNMILDRTNTRRLASDIQRALPNGGYIITILTNDEDILSFYEIICENGITYPTYTILNSLFNENLINKILQNAPENNKQCLNGFVVFDSYFESVGINELNTVGVPTLASTCNRDIHIQIGDDHKIIGDYESAYSAITFWKGLIRKTNSFLYEDITNLYHYNVETPSGAVEVNPNNNFNRRIYSGTINGQGEIVIDWCPTQSFKPLIYNQYNESEIGLICDFYNKDRGKRYDTNPIIITFFHEKDLGGRTEKYNALLIDLIVKEINDVGGILGRQIFANHTWLTISDAYRNARTIDEVGRSKTLFGCLTSECRSEVSRYIKDKDSLFFFTGRDDGFECQENMIVGGLNINQKSDVLIEYIGRLGIKKLYIVGSDRNSSYTELFSIEESVKKVNEESNNNENDEIIEIVGYSFLSPFNKEYVEEMLKDIESKLDKLNRVAIINLYLASENTQFINGYIDSTITSSSVIFFMKYDPLDLGEEVIKKLTGSYVVTSYSPSVTNTASGAFQYLMTAEYQDSIELNEILENTYSTIYTWKQAVEYSMPYCGSGCEWPGNDYIELSLKYISYDSPSGPIKTENNNHFSKDIYIFQLSDTSLIQVFPQQGIEYIVEGKMTYISSDDVKCIFSKNNVIYELNEVYRYLSISFSIINGLSCILVSGMVYYYRHTKIIKSASPLFLYYALISLFLLSVMGDIFTILADNKIVCGIRIWGLSLTIDLLFSIMFSKAWRIHKLFNNKQLQKVKVSNVMLLKMIGLILAIQIVYLIIWQIVAPSEPTLSFSSGHSTYLDDVYMRECSSNTIFVAIELVAVFLLFFWGARLAWSVRNASAEFNESMSLMATIAIMIIMGVILVPLDYLMSSETDTLMLLRSLGIEIGVFMIILVQFGSKVMYLYTTELSSTFGSSTAGSSHGSSAGSRTQRNKSARAAVSRGRFRLTPDILGSGEIAMATISEPQFFFEEAFGKTYSCVSGRMNSSRVVSSRRDNSHSVSVKSP